MVKIHKIIEIRLHAVFFRIKVPGGAWLHFDRKSSNPPHVGISVPDPLLELNGLLYICLFFKGDTEGEEKVTEDPIGFQPVKNLHQGLIRIGISFMNLSHLVRPDVRREGDQGFGPGKGFLKRLDKIDGGKSEGFEETFHLNFFLPDTREKLEKIFRLVRIRIEADVECLVPGRDRLPNGLENILDSPEGHLFSSGDGFQR